MLSSSCNGLEIQLIPADIVYYLARAKEQSDHVDLSLDMFTLTFGIYGGMIAFTMLVFLLELIFGSIARKSVQPLAATESTESQQTIEIIPEDSDENGDIHAIEKVEEVTNEA